MAFTLLLLLLALALFVGILLCLEAGRRFGTAQEARGDWDPWKERYSDSWACWWPSPSRAPSPAWRRGGT